MESRKRPVHGVHVDPSHPTIVFLTVCTKDRSARLASPENHVALREVWREATAWAVGRYVLMPDHLHVFAAPGRHDIALDNWDRYWKSRFSRTRPVRTQQWQAHHWDTRLRSHESYDAKRVYVRNNPVRAGLVRDADDWPYQGELVALPWW